jgi:photosystem II stability/assembly factor-like uncharacterized protein
MRHFSVIAAVLLSAVFVAPVAAEEAEGLSSADFAGLTFRELGPAVSSGRISDLAVNPDNPSHYFVAAASGGVWKTVNAGTTWTPVFDNEGSYSIGCVTMDPNNPDVVWVGTGENNSQRSVSFGDGVYKSLDGGATWTNMGLEESEHIGMIAVDPRDSDVVWVAAQGPLWRDGGDRGLYKTTDGGETWEKVLEISPMTGVNEVLLDPRDPDVVYASAYQRRRRVWTLINGGPESGLHKSTDGGETWREINNGLPSVDMGRIGLAMAPSNPDLLYAIVEAQRDEGGFYRSTNRGERWERMSDHVAGSPQYYNEIVVDPLDANRVYSLETWMRVTTDGGKTFSKIGSAFRHVDDHAMWINPENPAHMIVGCDGGIYETFDRAATYTYKSNLPLAQFYRLGIDNSEPFYFVYGGTQDNATLGGPIRTRSPSGITNEDWFVTVFGDGFQTRVDPTDPNIVYSEWQYGGLVRHDRRSGEIVDIQPQEPPGEPAWRWNWDAPLVISPHSHTRLYFAASRLFRSDDRGNSWEIISPDLSRGEDRNAKEIMGRVWGADAVAKNASTSVYGNAVALTESPLVEGLLYVGTDDGQIWVSEDAGETWRTEGTFPGVPRNAYVSRLESSLHDENTVFAAFSAHKDGDFTPYAIKSTDRGRTWTSIAGDLPERGMVWALAQDHVNADLLFAGTEFGVFFTRDGGGHWIQLKGGLPVIAVRDLALQRRENDLVLATFGRGFWVLDDYSALRMADESTLAEPASLFPIRPALSYIETSRLGLGTLKKAFQGDGFYVADNPPYGAVFTYHLGEEIQSREERRIDADADAREEERPVDYPSLDELREEDLERDPFVLLTVRDGDGRVVRRVEGPRSEGFHRVAWNLRLPDLRPVNLNPGPPSVWENPPAGPLALPGTYTVDVAQVVDGETTVLAGPTEFEVRALDLATFAADELPALQAFRLEAAELQRAVLGAVGVHGEVDSRLDHLHQAVLDSRATDIAVLTEIEALQDRLNALTLILVGDRTAARRNEAPAPSIVGRVNRVIAGQWYVTSAPTGTELQNLGWAGEAFAELMPQLLALDEDVADLERRLEADGAPWTPGRTPVWSR